MRAGWAGLGEGGPRGCVSYDWAWDLGISSGALGPSPAGPSLAGFPLGRVILSQELEISDGRSGKWLYIMESGTCHNWELFLVLLSWFTIRGSVLKRYGYSGVGCVC